MCQDVYERGRAGRSLEWPGKGRFGQEFVGGVFGAEEA